MGWEQESARPLAPGGGEAGKGGRGGRAADAEDAEERVMGVEVYERGNTPREEGAVVEESIYFSNPQAGSMMRPLQKPAAEEFWSIEVQRLRENVRQMTRDEIHRLRQRQEQQGQRQQGADGRASREAATLTTEAAAEEDVDGDGDVDADRPWRIEQVPRDFGHRAQPEAVGRHAERDGGGSGGDDGDDDIVELGTFKGAVKVDNRSIPPTPRAGLLQQEQEADVTRAVGAGLRGGGGDDTRYVTLFATFDGLDSEERYPSRALAAQVTG